MLLFTPSGFLTAGFYGPLGGDSTFYNFSSTTTATPASTTLRLNNATYSAVTALYLHELNIDSVNIGLFLDQITTSSQLILVSDADHSIYAIYDLSAAVDNGSDRTYTVTYLGGNGTFTDGSKLWFSILNPTAGSFSGSLDLPLRINLEVPNAGDRIILGLVSDDPPTLASIKTILNGTSSPAVTWSLRYGPDPTLTGSLIATATTNSNNTPLLSGSLTNVSPAINDSIWLEISAVSGTVEQFILSLF